ncbi:DUF4168 domain-containing protein [Roseofilum sp. BLCC_M154]|uniref:DUF4168 domain-containing protein n=1 Tax=Roseofilum acuticapitatum BLCC-M154 TaxID=3022444 RepID=A0ABT7AT24_9CYAN|nr:DUF4168 domain-containing protein [Roseofilum acuticapitatum]MDJ1170056.1 DUF4168 domain-containing protein [Roseofilum acuticapitatum BLCC-M154]
MVNVRQRIWSWGAIAALAVSFTGCGSSPEEMGASPAPVEPVTLTPEEVQNYARVILEIEPIREVALGQVQTLIDSGVAPIIICNDPQSLAGLSSEVTEVIVNYCTQSKEINAKYGFTPTRFNDITRNLNTDAQLKAQIDQALLAQVMNPEMTAPEASPSETPPPETPDLGL